MIKITTRIIPITTMTETGTTTDVVENFPSPTLANGGSTDRLFSSDVEVVSTFGNSEAPLEFGLGVEFSVCFGSTVVISLPGSFDVTSSEG